MGALVPSWYHVMPKALPYRAGMLNLTPDQDKEFARKYSREMQGALVDVGFWKCCLNCEHWSNNAAARKNGGPIEVCHLYGQRPPAEYIVHACPDWLCIVPF